MYENGAPYAHSVCLACGNYDLETKSAVISNFLLERIWNNSINNETSICHCKKCGFAFYALRPSENEMGKLYENYRDTVYQKQRQKHDSWYTKEINNLFDDQIVYKSRQEIANKFLIKHIDATDIKSVLDYGGSTGIHIPQIFTNAKKYVFDISGVKTVDGVQYLNNLDDANKQQYDFVMCTAVLEHVSKPNQILRQLKEMVSENGYLYIGVPFDSPFYRHKTSKPQFLFNKYFSFKVILDRFLRDWKHPFVMHEHINYFTENSLKEMLEKCGLTVLEIDTFITKGILGTEEGINVLAKT
jgi:2-polyprenyl-3-methyl-5-hydroxy-6-metoxy-1,4-benzoquinol methylase